VLAALLVGNFPGSLKNAGQSALLMTSQQNDGRLAELRFAKQQQWSIAAAAMALLGAIFGVAHVMAPLGWWEKALASLFALAVGIVACLHLVSLQNHLARTRRVIDEKDEDAWWRGGTILWSLVTVVAISTLAVAYYVIWRSVTSSPLSTTVGH
jgi:hypothetical protein